jgi:hypothetical protein
LRFSLRARALRIMGRLRQEAASSVSMPNDCNYPRGAHERGVTHERGS